MMNRLTLITDIATLWPLLLPHLERMAATGSVDWAVVDVLKACEAGRATMVGFKESPALCVVAPRINTFTRRPYLFVWIAVHDGPADERHEAALMEMARSFGADYIEMESPRRGWLRRGWEERMTTYRMEVRRET